MALPAIAPDGRLLVAGLDGCVSSYSRSGRFLWSFWAEGPVVGALAVARDGTAYVTTAGGHVQALRVDGTELWRRSIATGALGAALLSGGRLVVAGVDGALYSVAGGTLVWRRRVAERLATRPIVVGPDRVVVGDAEGTLHALEGAERHEERLGGRFRQDPAVGSGGSIAVVLDDDLVVVDGSLRERFTLRGVLYAGPAGEGWVAALRDGSLVQLDALGAERARVPLATAASASPVGVAGGALVPLESGELALVSAAAGGPRRAARIGRAPLLSPIVTDGGASVVAASASGDVAVLSLE
ncbi:MAG: PQQ-binding-like beta-propeller repeat protein [Polyangiaceae bacterium]|nr:PQQ-binding-like beta-propeller repeat protein [Polyangiaceae bacterium]